MNENYYNDGTEISITHFFFYLIRKCKTLLVAIIIGALIAGGAYFEKKNAAEKAVEEIEKEIEAESEEFEITPALQDAMEIAYQYRQLYEKQQAYNRESIIMQMDPNGVYTGELQYYVLAGENSELIEAKYKNIVVSDKILPELRKVAGIDYKDPYLKEILACGVSKEADAYSGGISESMLLDSSGMSKNLIIKYSVIYMDEDVCEEMLQVIADEVESVNAECQEQFEDYSFQTVNKVVSLKVDSTVLSKQKNNTDMANSFLNTVKSLEGALGEEELAYYKDRYLGKEIEEEELETEAEVFRGNPLKWLLAGILLGCVVWGACWVLVYFLDKKVKSPEELQKIWGLKLLGTLGIDSDQGKGFDGWLTKLEYKILGKPNSIDYVVSAVNALDQQYVQLCCNLEDEYVKNVAETLQKQCSALKVEHMLYLDKESLENAKKVDGVILFISVGKTSSREIRREMEVCELQNIQILGTIALQ